MSKALIIILVIIVIIGGYFLFFNKSNAPVVNENQGTPAANTTTNNPTIDTAKKVTVNYTNSGFSPKTISINKGDSVTFVNGSSGGMSVASDPHPTHTNYPELDQYKSTERGNKSYTFVFDKVGSWGYHNHLNPSNTGTVIVE